MAKGRGFFIDKIPRWRNYTTRREVSAVGLIPRSRTALDWFNLFCALALAPIAGFALSESCGPIAGRTILYATVGLFGVVGVVSNFHAVFRSAPDPPAHSHDHSH